MSDKEKIEAYLGYKMKNIRIHNKVLTIGINIIFFGVCLFLVITKKVTLISIPIFLAVLYLVVILFILLNKEKGQLYGKMFSFLLSIASLEYFTMFFLEMRDSYIYFWIFEVQMCIGVISYFIMKKIYINKKIYNILDHKVKDEEAFNSESLGHAVSGVSLFCFVKIVEGYSAMLAFWISIVICLSFFVYCVYIIAKLNYIYNNGYMYVVEHAEEKYYGAKEVAEQIRKEEKIEALRQNKWKY